MQQHGSKYLSHISPPPRTLGYVVQKSNSTFSEHGHGHVAFNKRESRMQQHGSKYFARRSPFTTPTLGMGSIGLNSN